jgi:hypothetical protein
MKFREREEHTVPPMEQEFQTSAERNVGAMIPGIAPTLFERPDGN